MTDASASRELLAIFAELRARLQGEVEGGADTSGALHHCSPAELLAERFDLTPFECGLVLLAAFAELEPDAAELFAETQGDPRLQAPSVALAFSILDDAHWSALAPDGALRRFELLELRGEGSTTAHTIGLPERVLQHLLGVDTIDESLLLLAQQLDATPELAPSRQAIVKELVARLGADQSSITSPVLQLCGVSRSEKIAIAATAAAEVGAPAFLMDADVIGANPRDRALLARRWEREMKLTGAMLVLDASDSAAEAEKRQVIALVEVLSGRVVVVTVEPLALPRRTSLRIDVPRVLAAEQIELWRTALGPAGERLNGTVERMASHFTLTPGVMASVGSELRRALDADPESDPDAVTWAASRRQARPRLGNLAHRIEGSVGWNDLVLAEPQLNTLRTIAAQVRQRVKVYEEWGFADLCRRGLGISALFVGTSGTGKTLAAEILGAALELDVYRIDLSSVVSKWIGETEKNLRIIFDAADEGCAVLLFDEADALFGKRSEVKDSHDRYANIEVSYLLQRLEAYRGLAILTTNMQDNIDDAFLRRIRFIVDFPFPDASERQEIWKRMFPDAAPTKGLRPELLSQLSLSGGSIRNIAVNAAFLAADAGGAVTMAHVLNAARTEYEKIGRSLTDDEIRGWQV